MCNDSKEHEEVCFVDKKYDINSVYKNASLLNCTPVVSCIGLGWVQIFPLVVGWVWLGQSAGGLGWIGSHKMPHGQL